MRKLKMVLFCGDQIAEYESPLGDTESLIEFAGHFYFCTSITHYGKSQGDLFLIQEIEIEGAMRWINKTFSGAYADELSAEIQKRAH